MSRKLAIPCKIYRGGTSRGLVLDERDLPHPREMQSRILRRALGSPDARQIDGLGGANSQTSKAMLIRPEASSRVDVSMRFAQVGISTPVVDWGGNCGNLTAAVGPYAIESGMIVANEPTTVVRIRSLNTGISVHAHVPVREGMVTTEGDYTIPGVPGHGARIDLEWLDPGGSVTGKLLPTGRTVDTVRLCDGRQIEISMVDAGNPVAFCDAKALGLRGTELPAEIESRREVISTLEEIRCIAAEMLGIVKSQDTATQMSPSIPKVAMVAPPARYRTSTGGEESKEGHDLHARMLSMQTAHRSYAVTGAIATAVASLLTGTVVHAALAFESHEMVRIAHPYGVIDVRVRMEPLTNEPKVLSVIVGRTARLLMSGSMYVPESVLEVGRTDQEGPFEGDPRDGMRMK